MVPDESLQLINLLLMESVFVKFMIESILIHELFIIYCINIFYNSSYHRFIDSINEIINLMFDAHVIITVIMKS